MYSDEDLNCLRSDAYAVEDPEECIHALASELQAVRAVLKAYADGLAHLVKMQGKKGGDQTYRPTAAWMHSIEHQARALLPEHAEA